MTASVLEGLLSQCTRTRANIFNIDMFSSGNNFTVTKQVYYELAESRAVDFDINVRSNLTELVEVTGMGVTVSRARLRYTREYWRQAYVG